MKDSTRRTLRTAVWGTLAFAAMLPGILEVAAVDVSTLPWLAGVVAATTGITRVMAAPQVEAFLQTYLPWLAKQAPDGRHELGRDESTTAGAPVDGGRAHPVLLAGLLLAALAVVCSVLLVADRADAKPRPVVHVDAIRVMQCGGVVEVAYGFERVNRWNQWVWLPDDGTATVELHHLGANAGPGGSWVKYPAASGGEGRLRIDVSAGIPFWDSARVTRGGYVSSPVLPVECAY